jgi:hypothetical protein
MSHSFNMDQRFLDLTFRATGSHVAVQAPTHAGEAPPGFYLLFVFNESWRAVDREGRSRGHRQQPEPRHRADADESGRTDQRRRYRCSTLR